MNVTCAECHFCWGSLMLGVTYTECHFCWVSLVLNVNYYECHYAECHILWVSLCWVLLCWVTSLMLCATYAECHLHRVSLKQSVIMQSVVMPSVTYLRWVSHITFYVECHYAEWFFPECHGATEIVWNALVCLETKYEENVVTSFKSNLLLMIFWFYIINYNS